MKYQIQLILVFLKQILKKIYIKKLNEIKKIFFKINNDENYDESLNNFS